MYLLDPQLPFTGFIKILLMHFMFLSPAITISLFGRPYRIVDYLLLAGLV